MILGLSCLSDLRNAKRRQLFWTYGRIRLDGSIPKGSTKWRPEYFNLEQVLEFMNDGSDVYLAEWNNEIVGTYILTWSDPFIWQELDNLESGYIHRFAVNRKYRIRRIDGVGWSANLYEKQ